MNNKVNIIFENFPELPDLPNIEGIEKVLKDYYFEEYNNCLFEDIDYDNFDVKGMETDLEFKNKERNNVVKFDLQDYKNNNDILRSLDIKTSIYPRELCSFVSMICRKYNIKASQRVYDTVLDFMIKIKENLKKTQKTNYLKEYQEMIKSFL